MLPNTTRVVVMFNPIVSPVNQLFHRSVEDAARSFDVEVTRAPVQDDTETAKPHRGRIFGSPTGDGRVSAFGQSGH